MPASRLLITACPIPAEASTSTDSVVIARIAQRGRRGGRTDLTGRSGGRGTRRGGCGRRCGRAGDRGGLAKKDTSGRGRTWDP
ncbi:hypothetical protein GCM10010339_72130 [Streptomyces alanosinicus]|uniref:Uncharacterized protein n=1 Tax=Streptomyces alanosinicus TaxID=68171 RepID=A0A919D7U3_9ACTN|nr:hypothetical protein GCM10010339_72130 [Streptomyces alanosinicus]